VPSSFQDGPAELFRLYMRLDRLRGFDLYRIGKQAPVTYSLQLFELPNCTVSGLIGADHVGSVYLLLQTLELVPAGAEQILEKADAISGHDAASYD
jgi:hypothetical protein